MAAPGRHLARQYRTVLAGVEAIAIASDRSFPRHSHDAYGFGVMLEGGHASWSGRGQVEAGPGDVITVNPGEMHDGRPVAGAVRRWRMLFLHPGRMDAETEGERSGEVTVGRPVLDDPAAAQFILRAFEAAVAPRPDTLAAEESLTLAIAHLIRSHGTRTCQRAGAPPASVALARRRLDEAPEQPVSLGELAAMAGISRFQLIRSFARSLGTTPHVYLVSRRVLRAREALKAGAFPADAAALAGFADQSHMTRAFVRQFGITPGRYRAAVRG